MRATRAASTNLRCDPEVEVLRALRLAGRFINSSGTHGAPSTTIPSTAPVVAVAAPQLTGSMRNCTTRRSAAGGAAPLIQRPALELKDRVVITRAAIG